MSDEHLPPRTYPDGTPLDGMNWYRGNKETVSELSSMLGKAKSLSDRADNLAGVEEKIEEPVETKKEQPEGFYAPMETTAEEIQVNRALAFERVRKPYKDLSDEHWQALVNNAAAMARMGEKVTITNLKKACPYVDSDLIEKVMASKNFAKILEQRGVLQDNSSVGMTERQFMALNVLTNYTDTRKIHTKLKSIGVSDSEFQQWLSSNGRFRKIYRKLSEQFFDEAQASVNVALTSGAVDGDIRFIKYFNEMSGRFDPAAKQNMDVQQVLSAITEIITSVVKDPDLLREIGGRMSMLVGGSGIAGGALNSTVQNVPELENNSTSSGFFN